MTGRVVPFPTASAPGGRCPAWCDLADDGHSYRFGLDDSEPPTFHRLHRLRLADLANGQARLDVHQLETAADPERSGILHPPEVVLSMPALSDGIVTLSGPGALVALIETLRKAACQLENDGAWDQ